jgi:hypothetical protein
MPQTCFRTVYVNTPVTTYRAEPACGPCGTPTTVMRPVVSYVMRPQLVPYTTYRPVVTAAPVVAATYYAPAPVAVAPAAPCCGAGAAVAPAPLAMPAGAMPMPAAAPLPMGTPGASVPSRAPTPAYPAAPTANTVPSLATPPAAQAQPGGEAQPGKTFGNGGSTETNKPADTTTPLNGATPSEGTPNYDPSKPAPQSRLLLPAPPPAADTNRGALRGLDPEDQDRVTAIPLRQAFAVRPASLVTPLPAPARPQPAAPAPASDWRASRP